MTLATTGAAENPRVSASFSSNSAVKHPYPVTLTSKALPSPTLVKRRYRRVGPGRPRTLARSISWNSVMAMESFDAPHSTCGRFHHNSHQLTAIATKAMAADATAAIAAFAAHHVSTSTLHSLPERRFVVHQQPPRSRTGRAA